MAYTQSTKDELRRAYVFQRLSLDKAASISGVSYATAQRWKRQAAAGGDDWDKVKAAHTLAGGELEDIGRQLLTDLVLQFKATMELVKLDSDIDAKTRVELLTSLSDSYNKAISANRKLLPETSKLAVALTVLEQLAAYIGKQRPELLGHFLEILEPFGQMIERELNKYG